MTDEEREVTRLQRRLRKKIRKLLRHLDADDFPHTDAEAIAHLARAHRDLTH